MDPEAGTGQLNCCLRVTIHQQLANQLQILLEPYTYISANPGKEIRSLLINAFNVWLKVPEPELEIVRNIVRMLHNASLLCVISPLWRSRWN